MRTNYIFFCLLLGCSLLAHAEGPVATAAEPAEELSLQQAVELALNANPEIAVALREREAIQGMQMQAATRPNPTLTARVEDTRSATRESFVEISQPIELGNKRAMRVEAAESYYDAASAAIDLKKAEIQANVISAFYRVLAAQERMRLAESSLNVAQRAREAASKQVEAGKVSPVEETRSKIAESGVRIELAQAKSALAIARKQLAALWGNPLPSFRSAQGSVETMQALPPLEHLHQQLDLAPALLQAKLEVDTRQALVEVERTKSTPDIAVTLGTKHNAQIDNQAVIGVAIPLMVFDQNQGNIHEALSRVDKARAEVAALRIQLQAALAAAHEQLQAARLTSESYENDILPGARSAFEAARKGFELGKFDFLPLLDAERTLIQARMQYLDALLQGHQAVADIKRILGDAINIRDAMPQEPQ